MNRRRRQNETECTFDLNDQKNRLIRELSNSRDHQSIQSLAELQSTYNQSIQVNGMDSLYRSPKQSETPYMAAYKANNAVKNTAMTPRYKNTLK